jgi:hypothetical protein
VAGTAYYEGQPVRINANGSAARVLAAGTCLSGFTGNDVTSAAIDGSNQMLVYYADANTQFEAKMLASFAPQAKLMEITDFLVGTTHNFRLAATASGGAVRIVGVHPDEVASAHTGCRYFIQGNKITFAQVIANPSA